MDAHPFAFQEHRARAIVDLDLPVVDERQPRTNRLGGRDRVVLIVIELPDVGQRAERDVERAVGPLADLPGHAQHVAHVGGDRHRVVAGRGVDAQDVAARTPRAHLRFEPLELREHRIERRPRGRFVRGPRRQVQIGTHRDAGALYDVHARGAVARAIPAAAGAGKQRAEHDGGQDRPRGSSHGGAQV